MLRPLFLIGTALANLLGPCSAQLDFGESLESDKCSFANFQARVDEVEAACCGAGGCPSGGAPTQCDVACAVAYVPFWTECFDMLALVLGQGHRRALRSGSGDGTMKAWERLADTCGKIDSSQLLIAIKDLTDQGCYSPSLANECSDGWTLAAAEVCFSAGGADAGGHQQCTTTGGNVDEGSSCYFPFVWSAERSAAGYPDGATSAADASPQDAPTYSSYTECTPLRNNNVPWCSTTPDFEGGGNRWGNCVCVESDAHFGHFSLPVDTPGIKLVHKSGGVSCNSARGFLSNWGCDLEQDSSLGTFVTSDCQTTCDTSHIVAPPASRITSWANWYSPYNQNWAGADELVFQEDHDAEHPQGNFHAGNCKHPWHPFLRM